MLPELPLDDLLVQFAVLVALVLLVQLALQRIFVPALLGLLLLGIALGPGGANVVPREPLVALLGEIGLIYIMFIAGLEINLSVVQRHKGETFGFGLVAFVASVILGGGLGLALGFDWPAALLLGALLSSHTLIAYPVLQRRQLLGTRPAVAAVGGTVLTDTLALLGLALLLQLAGGGEDGRSGWWWLPLLLLAALAATSIWLLPRLARALYRREWVTPAEKALFALLVLLALSVLAELIGTEKILGAFLAGLCLNQVLAEQEETRQHVQFVGRMLFVPFFFVATGMLLETDALISSPGIWGTALLLCAVVLAGKAIAAWTIGAYYGYSRDGRWLMLGLTIPQAAATLAITVAGREVGLLSNEIVDAVIIVILITCAAGPLLTAWAATRMQRQERSNHRATNEPSEMNETSDERHP